MKRVCLTVLLMLSLCLTACGKNEESIVYRDEDCVAVVEITINPALELRLDAAGKIIKVEGTNEDGQQLLKSCDVLGLPYAEGLERLLNQAAESGFLREGAAVQVKVIAYDETQNWRQMTDQTIMDFQNARNIKDLDVQVAGDVQQKPDSDPQTGTDDPTSSGKKEVALTGNESEVERDADGNIIKTVEITALGDTRILAYDSNGNLMQETLKLQDGNREEIMYENDLPVKKIFYRAGGGYEETEFVAGVAVKSAGQETDGTVYEQTHHANGMVAQRSETRPNGEWSVLTYYENGNRQSVEGEYLRADGKLTWYKYLYDSNGVQTEYFGVDQDDNPVHIVG